MPPFNFKVFIYLATRVRSPERFHVMVDKKSCDLVDGLVLTSVIVTCHNNRALAIHISGLRVKPKLVHVYTETPVKFGMKKSHCNIE